ncbi:MAG: hypothetical protein R2731_07435 [Nocardioides sp.]
MKVRLPDPVQVTLRTPKGGGLSTWTPLVSMLIALAAVVVGPFLQHRDNLDTLGQQRELAEATLEQQATELKTNLAAQNYAFIQAQKRPAIRTYLIRSAQLTEDLVRATRRGVLAGYVTESWARAKYAPTLRAGTDSLLVISAGDPLFTLVKAVQDDNRRAFEIFRAWARSGAAGEQLDSTPGRLTLLREWRSVRDWQSWDLCGTQVLANVSLTSSQGESGATGELLAAQRRILCPGAHPGSLPRPS